MLRKSALILTLLMLLLTGCTEQEQSPAETVTAPVVPDGYHIVVDQSGTQVVLKQDIKSTALIYGPSINFLLALGVADRVVGVSSIWGFFSIVEPQLANVGTVGRGSVDLEAVAKLKPDVFIHRKGDNRTVQALAELGIPTVCIWPESTEDIKQTIRVLGETFGVQQRAEDLVAYYEEKVAFAQELLQSVPPEERKTAIVMGTELGRVAHGTMLQSFMLETAGAYNCAKQIESVQTWPLVGTEEIFAWNPDFIFCTNSPASEYSVEEVMENSTWSELKAVKNKQVLLVPTLMDSWEFPGMASCLGFLWMLSQMYPDIYPEEEFLAEVDSFYQFMYGMTFSRDYLGF